MLLILFILAGLLLGLISGGRLTDPGKALPKDLHLPIVAFAAETLFSIDPVYPSWFALIIVYGLLFWFCFSNIPQGIWAAFLLGGTLLNFLVIAANGFRMPVLALPWKHMIQGSMMEALIGGDVFGYVLADVHTRLLFLGDVIAIAPFGKLLGFASPGDIVMGIGAAMLAYKAVKSNPLFVDWENGIIMESDTGGK